MSKLKFKTNIRCGNCVRNVSPFLNKSVDIETWSVDTESEMKILTVETDLDASEVIKMVEEAGFTAEVLNE